MDEQKTTPTQTPEPQPAAQPGLRQLFQEPWFAPVARFLGGQWVSMLGSFMVQFAMTFYITKTTLSGGMLAVATVCMFLPQVVIAPLAGVWADRYDRKKLAIFSDAGIAAATLLMAMLWFAGLRSVWMIFALGAVRAIGSGIQSPAVSAILPQMVPEQHLMRVNGINASAQSLISLVSPALGGWLLAVAPIAAVFMVDVVTAVIGIGLLLSAAIPKHERQAAPLTTNPWQDLTQGLRYSMGSPFIRVLLLFNAAFMLLMVPGAVLSPLMVQLTFGTPETAERVMMLNEVGFSAGMLIGGALIAAWGGFKNRGLTVVLSTLLTGVFTVVLGLTSSFGWYLVFIALLGWAMALCNTPLTTMMQENIAPEMMGRVFSLVGMVGTLIFPMGAVIFGPMADTISVQTMFVVTGIGIALLSLIMGANPTLRKAGLPKAVPMEAAE